MSLTYKRFLNMLAVISVAAYFVEVGLEMEGDLRFLILERCVAIIFTIELFIQLKRETAYWKTGEFIVDILSILPFYVGFFVPAQYLGIIRTLRVFRLLKLFWHNDSFTVMKNAFALAWPSVRNVGFCLICLALFCSAILFQVEPTTFGSIGNTLYFVLTTITTIGFGDYSPKTGLGKAITIFLLYGPSLMVCGSLIGVVCSSYQTSLEQFNKTKHESD
jgi:voltage-gated potassium channel